jgi:hypothetical protein
MVQRFPAVTFAKTLAGLLMIALAAMPASAQHAGSSPGHPTAGGTHLGVPQSSGGVAHNPSAARPPSVPAPAGAVNTPPGRIFLVRPHVGGPSPSSGLALQNPPAAVRGIGFLRPGFASESQRLLGRGLGFRGESARLFSQFPYFFFGGGQPVCSPFLPGDFGAAWFDSQFTCFGVPFYGVQFYPPGFLAPELAYEPWLEGLATSGPQEEYSVADDTLVAEDLGAIADIAATESVQSNPDQEITMLVLKEGISFAVTDYWVENGKLGYVTTYGRENIIDLDQVDLDQTVKLNSLRGVPFVLRPRPAPSTPPR